MDGTIELSGRSPGASMFAGDAGKLYKDVRPGIAKSSISLLSIMPVDWDRIRAPQLEVNKTVKMIEIYILDIFRNVIRSSKLSKKGQHKEITYV